MIKIKSWGNLIIAYCALAYGAVIEIISHKSLLIIDVFLATIVPFVTQYIIWAYIYNTQDGHNINSYTYQSLMTYYAYSIVFWRLNNSYSVVEYFSFAINSGDIEPRLNWPIPIPIQRLFDFLGGAVIYIWPIVAVVIVHFYFLDKAQTPQIWQMGTYYDLGVILQIIMSQILCYLIGFIIATTTFWFVRADFSLSLLSMLQAFLGGIMLPPSFWPKSMQIIMDYNPFRYLIATPAQLISNPNVEFLYKSLSITLIYIVLFILIGMITWKQTRKTYNSIGG